MTNLREALAEYLSELLGTELAVDDPAVQHLHEVVVGSVCSR